MLGFWRNDKGSVAIVFALAAVPMIGIAGMGLDYMRASQVRASLQAEADAAALASAASIDTSQSEQWMARFDAAMTDKFSDAGLSNLKVEGTWLSTSDFRVQASGGGISDAPQCPAGSGRSFRCRG